MMEKVHERREALIKHYQELLTQHQQVSAQLQQLTIGLERIRGALALCDELLAPEGETETVAVGPNGAEAHGSA